MKRLLVFVVLAVAVLGATVFDRHVTSSRQRQAEVAQLAAKLSA